MPDRYAQLSRTIAHALRHDPERYGLVLDKGGWVALDALVRAIACDSQWAALCEGDVHAMMAAADKQRYEISGRNIRAIYGHSIPAKIERAPATPPDVLYHGTTRGALGPIRRDGLKPMRRQYVHLSTDAETAAIVARRRTSSEVIIQVKAKVAHNDGVIFQRGNDQVWLAKGIAARYLVFPDE
jgi:putative RNA 2'-phosphotransferase